MNVKLPSLGSVVFRYYLLCTEGTSKYSWKKFTQLLCTVITYLPRQAILKVALNIMLILTV